MASEFQPKAKEGPLDSQLSPPPPRDPDQRKAPVDASEVFLVAGLEGLRHPGSRKQGNTDV